MQTPDADAALPEGPSPGELRSAAPRTSTAAHEVLSLVMPLLELKDRVAISRVSREWRAAAVKEHHLWRSVDAGESNLKGWGGLCHWAGACNVGALKASLAFFPGFYKMMDAGIYGEYVYDGPTRLALLLGAAQCTSLTSLHLCIDNGDVGSESYMIHTITGGEDDRSCVGLVEFPTSLRQLEFEFDRHRYRLIPNIAQLTALTALSCRIDGYWAENLPAAFPASLKRLEIYNSHCDQIIPLQVTSITRLESLRVINETYIDYDPRSYFDYALDDSLLDVEQGKEEHDEWCRHLTYLGFTEKLFSELLVELPRNLVTLELLHPSLPHVRDLEVCLAAYSALHNLRQLRRLTYKPFQTNHMDQINILRGFGGLEVLDLRGDSKLVLPLEIPALHTLKHLAINLEMLHRYTGFFSVLTRLESLNLSVKEVGYHYFKWNGSESENEENEESEEGEGEEIHEELRDEDVEGWMDAPVLDALMSSCPNLKAIYCDNYRLRCIWGVPATEECEPEYREDLARKLRYYILETPLAIEVNLNEVLLLPEEEWESAVGYSRQWTPWDQVEGRQFWGCAAEVPPPSCF